MMWPILHKMMNTPDLNTTYQTFTTPKIFYRLEPKYLVPPPGYISVYYSRKCSNGLYEGTVNDFNLFTYSLTNMIYLIRRPIITYSYSLRTGSLNYQRSYSLFYNSLLNLKY